MVIGAGFPACTECGLQAGLGKKELELERRERLERVVLEGTEKYREKKLHVGVRELFRIFRGLRNPNFYW